MIVTNFEGSPHLRPEKRNLNLNIKITADSTCDLSAALLAQWNISLIPMHILMGDESYLDGVTIHPADVFAHAQNGGKMPKSSWRKRARPAGLSSPTTS